MLLLKNYLNITQSTITDDLLAGFLSKSLVYPNKTSRLLPGKEINKHLKLLPNKNGVTKINGLNIFWRVIEPANYNLKVSWPNKMGECFPEIKFNHSSDLRFYKKHKGVVVLIHGWMMNGDCMLPWAMKLASKGYRCVCVDLRNHGKSGIRRAGYGVYESGDVSALIDELKKMGVISKPIHLFGISYGAATSLFIASIRKDIKSVISIESFSSARRAVENMVPHLINNDAEIKPTSFDFLNNIVKKRYNEQILQRAIELAGEKIGFDLESIRPANVMDKIENPLIIHGKEDMHVRVEHGRELHANCPHGKYIEVKGENHLTLPARFDILEPEIISWLEK